MTMTKHTALIITILLTVGFSATCSREESERKSNSSIPTASQTSRTPRPSSKVEDEVSGMRVAGINRIYVLRRIDGAVFDGEDKAFLRSNMPLEINRRVSSDDEKAFVIGSTFIIPSENINAWKSRFKVQDMSEKTKK